MELSNPFLFETYYILLAFLNHFEWTICFEWTSFQYVWLSFQTQELFLKFFKPSSITLPHVALPHEEYDTRF